MLVHHLLSRCAETSPQSTAVIDQTSTITYEALDNRANRIARALMQRGVRQGDRVVLAMENSIDWIACYFGILKAGGVAVPIAAGAKSDRLPHVIRDCSPSACMTDSHTVSAFAAQLGGMTTVVRHASDARGRYEGAGPIAGLDAVLQVTPDSDPALAGSARDLAAIVYTSGSTGPPRGVMLSHANICSNTESIVEYLRMSSADRMMVVLPFHYVYGLSLLHTHVRVAGSLVVDNRFAFPNVVLQAMQTHQVTGFAGVPSTFAILLHRSAMARMTFPHLRYVTQAGGGLAQTLIREWQTAMPAVPLVVMYGATEASARLTYLEPEELSRRPGSIGRAIPSVEVHVVREDGQLAQPGEVGELTARGPNIMAGYWGRPDESRAAFSPWGYRTGDLAIADEDGFLYLVGRKQDMLKVGAHRVGAAEIEEVLHEHDAVDQAAVVGAADELLGEVPVAFATARETCAIEPEDLISFCRRRLPDYKVPTRVVLVDDLPRTETGKIDKNALRRALAGAPARQTAEARELRFTGS
jgi:amino acid adenylation domain-containing protein